MTELLFQAGPIEAVQRLLGLGWPEPWRAVSLLGSNWGILLVVGVAFWLWGRRTAYALLAVVVVDGLLKTALNRLLHVPRPDGPGIVTYERVALGSFPSGHVATAAALWGWLAHAGRIGWPAAVVVTLLVGVSRLYLGVHYLADVVGGVLLAALTVALVHRLWAPVRDWLGRRSFRFWGVAASLSLAGAMAGAFFFYGTNPYQWRAGGLVAGLAIGLPLEYHYVRYRPTPASRGRKAAMLVIGAAGIAALAAVDQLTGERSTSLGFGATALGALWTVLVAPTLFARLG